MKALEAAALAERQQKKRARDAKYYAKRKASKSVEISTQTRTESVGRQGKDEVFRGITWRDVPGRDEAARLSRPARTTLSQRRDTLGQGRDPLSSRQARSCLPQDSLAGTTRAGFESTFRQAHLC